MQASDDDTGVAREARAMGGFAEGPFAVRPFLAGGKSSPLAAFGARPPESSLAVVDAISQALH